MHDYESASDDRLVELGRGGNRDAWGELIERHKDSLVNYLTRMCGDRQRAEDLAQDAFVRLIQRAGQYRARGHFRAYLFRIAANLLRSRERRRRRWQHLARLLPVNGHRADVPEPASSLLARERDRRIAAAVAELPHDYRAPIVLFNLEGWSYREIAEALGCREGTVKSRIHRGRRMLRDRLEPYWSGERA